MVKFAVYADLRDTSSVLDTVKQKKVCYNLIFHKVLFGTLGHVH